ncbi:MAG: hypothetical protein KR126chlam2_00006 [Chlamydiae bacterium]|nr:hypothetical protein [Chlamydiota bacterium]
MSAQSCSTECNRGLGKVGHFLGHFLLFAIRLYWGSLFIKAGIMKFSQLGNMAEMFSNVSIPFPYVAVIIVAIFEIVGGVSWILGLFSRLFSIPLIILLVVAYFTAHIDALTSIFTNPSLFTSDVPFLFLYTALVIFCFGPGKISLDYLICRKSPK